MKTLRNKVQLIGNLGSDPEVKDLIGGKTIAKLTLATSDTYKKASGEKVTETQWHNLVAWGKTAEIVGKYLKKGNRVAIEGRLVNRSYDDKKGSSDYWLIKTDSSGNLIWDKTIGSVEYDSSPKIKLDNNENILIAGSSNTGSSATGDKSIAGYGSTDVWSLKINSSNATIIWDKTVGGDNNDNSASVEVLNNEIYLLAASSSSISGTITTINNGNSDYWLTKLDNDGNILWDNTYGGASSETPVSITKTSVNNLLLSGYSDSDISGDKSESNRGNMDYWIISVDTAGTDLWQKTLGGTSIDHLFSSTELPNNTFLLGGRSLSNNNGDKTDDRIGDFDYWLCKIKADIPLSTQNQISNNDGPVFANLFPNPAKSFTTIEFISVSEQDAKIQIMDIMGKSQQIQIFHAKKGTNIVLVNLSDFTNGCYFVSILLNDNIISNKLIVSD